MAARSSSGYPHRRLPANAHAHDCAGSRHCCPGRAKLQSWRWSAPSSPSRSGRSFAESACGWRRNPRSVPPSLRSTRRPLDSASGLRVWTLRIWWKHSERSPCSSGCRTGSRLVRSAEACHQVREWAEEHSLTDAAMLFAEAAAMVEPERAAHANIAGRLCRRSAHDERSRTWYQRAYRLAARARDRRRTDPGPARIRGLMYHLGNHAEARRYNEQAVGVARNYGRRAKAAEAKHDMLLIAADSRNLRRR